MMRRVAGESGQAPVAIAAGGGRRASSSRRSTRASRPPRRSALTPTNGASSPAGPTSLGRSRRNPSDPIDSRYLTELPFGKSSFWIQPWRAYLDTWPASRLLDSLGINFNVKPGEAQGAPRTCCTKTASSSRVSGSIGAPSPTRTRRGSWTKRICARGCVALHENGLRPLILLDANSAAPCPAKRVALDTVGTGARGSYHRHLDAASAAEVVPGRTGFDAVVFASPKRTRRRLDRRGGRRQERRRAHARRAPERREARRAARQGAGLTALVREGNPAILITKVGARPRGDALAAAAGRAGSR